MNRQEEINERKLLPAALTLAMSPMTLAGATALIFPRRQKSLSRPQTKPMCQPKQLSTSAMIPGQKWGRMSDTEALLDSKGTWSIRTVVAWTAVFSSMAATVSPLLFMIISHLATCRAKLQPPVPEALELSFESPRLRTAHLQSGHIEMLSDGGALSVQSGAVPTEWDLSLL